MVEKKAVIFDLDDTLVDSANTCIAKAYRSAVDELRRDGLDERYVSILDREYRKPKGFAKALESIRDVAPAELLERVMRMYYEEADVSVTKMFPDTDYVLSYLRSKGYRLAVVTSGNYSQQKKKLSMFDFENRVDDIYVDESESRAGKSRHLTEFAEKHGLSPQDVLVVGDNLSNEIKAGNELGMETVRILKGRYAVAEPKDASEMPVHTIRELSDLLVLLEDWSVT